MPNMTWSPDLRPRSITWFLAALWLCATVVTAQEDLTTWNKRMPITLAGYTPPTVAETLTNFPVLVVLSNTPSGAGFDYNDFLAPPYGDLRFSSASNGTPLNYEVETWNTNGNSFVWVQVPAVTDATTQIWAFWGKSANLPVTATNGATWSNAYLGVWHMATNTSAMIDSSTNRRGSSISGTMAIAPGMAGNACDFTPTAYLQASNNFSTLSGAYTISAWVNMDANGSNEMAILGCYSATNAGFYLPLTNATRKLAFYNTAWRTSGTTLPAAAWKQVAYTRNDTNGFFFLDGVPVAKITNALPCAAGTTLRIGTAGSAYNIPFDGRIDEVQISAVDRSSNWMSAAYQNLANTAFLTYGNPDNGGRPVISNNSATVDFSAAATLNGTLVSAGSGSGTKVFVFWGPTDGGANLGAWAYTNQFADGTPAGPLSCVITGNIGAGYFYRYYATNSLGDSWANPSMTFTAGVLPVTKTWSATAGSDSNWFTASNWTPSGSPSTGDVVLIDSSLSTITNVVLTNATAPLGALIISNRYLTCSNWTTAINATNVILRNAGIFTLPSAFTNNQMSNRVWIVCSNLIVHTGATINVDALGYADRNGRGAGTIGTGGSGAGYGGKGGMGGALLAIGNPYGSTNAPLDPGSGTASYIGSAGHHGGGAVRIDASGSVIINGLISANAGRVTSPSPVNFAAGGSGGAIYISCKTLGGTTNGMLRANGGSGGSSGGGGGGGRIAIDYQSLDGTPGVQCSANRGVAGWQTIDVNSPLEAYAPQMGTLWFPNPDFIDKAISAWSGSGLSAFNGYVYFGNTNAWTATSLVLSNSTLGIPGCNNWTFSNGLTLVSGGLIVPTNAAIQCNGNLLMTNSSTLIAYGGRTNAANAYGTLVTVTGTLTIATNCWIYPFSESTNGGSVRFQVGGNLIIQMGGGVNAYGRGFAYGTGYGKGTSNAGGGYGGKGGNSQGGTAGGSPYGVTNAPRHPGSGGSRYGAVYPTYNNGGGLIWFEIIGDAIIDGTLNANGAAGNNPPNYGAGGSGGAILLLCNSLSGGNSGRIWANGGTGGTAAGAGGGGRVSIAIGFSETERQLLLANSDVPGLNLYYQHPAYLGQMTAATNGTGYYTSPPNGAIPGTAQFMKIIGANVFTVTINGSPAQYGAPTTNAYGAWSMPLNTVFTNTVTSPANELNGLRRACIGWRVTDTALGSLITNDVTTQSVFTVNTNLTLTWYWTNEYQLAISAGPSGSVNWVDKNGWYTNGTSVSGLLATPDPNYYFAGWLGGDVTYGQETLNPMTVIQDRPRSNIMAVFATTNAMTRTWTGRENWLNPTNWSPIGVPGSNDAIILKSGTSLVSIASTINSLLVSNGATLVFSNWNTCLTVAGAVTVWSNGFLSLPGAFTTNQMSNRIWIACSDFTLHTGATINADALGYANDNGPGRGISAGGSSGAGYGGKGGNGQAGPVGGNPYGSTNAPTDPGSGGPTYGGDPQYLGHHGGGAILIQASGKMTLHGTVSANAARLTSPSPVNYAGGASGGSIYLICGAFTGGTNGLMRAMGANGGTSGGGGGGGRGAVWIGVRDYSRTRYLDGILGRVIRSDVAPLSYLGNFSSTNGTGWQNGNPGTFFFFSEPPDRGTVFTIH
jgi:hypothetical protein